MNAALSIRPARPEDAAAIAGVLNPIIAAGRYTVMRAPVTIDDQLEFFLAFPARGIFHVAVEAESGRVLGLQDVRPVSSESAFRHVGEISTFVALDAFRRGIGRALCDSTFAAAKDHGFEKLMATIRADNPGAIAFYRRQGFEIIGTARRHALVRGQYLDEVLVERWSGVEDCTQYTST